jgi:aryl-alcohol dehydrogenase-like predicted oxidoreductase|tara:strand:- start:1838 stop:2050 length:213 start_codon:yes stop_codon:yes gene_type:complete
MSRLLDWSVDNITHHWSDHEREEYFSFLDELRESGKTNMFGASRYLEDNYGLHKKTASDILEAWMKEGNK